MIIAFHGQQGSGKTTLVEKIYSGDIFKAHQKFSNMTYRKISIKDCINIFVNPIISHPNIAPKITKDKYLSILKNLQRRISTWAEEFVDSNIWSDMYVERVHEELLTSDCILTEDIRTPMNLKALQTLSNVTDVYLFRLVCPEEIRRERVSVWREPNSYTENLLERPISLPKNMVWQDLDTTQDINTTLQIIRNVVR